MNNPSSVRIGQVVSAVAPKVARWLAAGCALMIATSAGAQRPHVIIEECLETGIPLASLPGAPSGSLSVECRGCTALRLKFDQRTQFFIGGEPVPYARLRQSVGKAPASISVCYNPATRVLTRLRRAAIGNNQ